MRLEDYLLRNAAKLPHRTALLDTRRRVDYAELLGESRALAAALHRRGVASGDRVAVIAPNRVELISAAFACFLGGFVFQPINFRLSSPELANILDNAQPAALIVDGAAFPLHAEFARARTGLRALAILGAQAADHDWCDGCIGLPDPSDYLRPREPTTVAALLYTGGTTGTPKGTVLSHRAWIHASRDGAWAMRLTPRDVSYQCVPLFHVSFVHFLSTFYVGVPTILRERVRPAEIVDAILHQGVTHTTLVQAALVDLVDHLDTEGIDLPPIRTLQYGGSPIAPAVIERVCHRFRHALHQNYGSTEAGGAVTFLPPEDHDPDQDPDRWRARVASAGFAMPGSELAIVDDHGERLGPGELGAIWVRSESLMTGYWGNPDATAEALVADGWLITGDIGRLDEDGYLYIFDRAKDMIISGGENIYARDVEDTLLAHPDVREVAVVGGPHPRFGEEVVAYVVVRAGGRLTSEALIAWTGDRLARYKRPAQVHFEASLPRTPVGKIHKPTLREWLRTPRT
jgi:acyl-CoA synthetase (AMP-forming)/AMP-acid ligase II